MDQLASFNQRETLFELVLSDKSELQRMIDEFQPYLKLWINVNNFKESNQDWTITKKIQDLNANEIQSKTDIWYRECFMLNKKLLDKSPEAVAAINQLKEELEVF